MATALPRSMTLPPPIAATTSAPCSRAATAPARARSIVGSPGTANIAAGRSKPDSRSAWRPGFAPVHTSTRDPSPASSPGSSAARPGPATMRAAVANSNAVTVSRSPTRPRPPGRSPRTWWTPGARPSSRQRCRATWHSAGSACARHWPRRPGRPRPGPRAPGRPDPGSHRNAARPARRATPAHWPAWRPGSPRPVRAGRGREHERQACAHPATRRLPHNARGPALLGGGRARALQGGTGAVGHAALRHERDPVERGEALGIGEGLGLHGHYAAGLDKQPPVGGVAEVNLDENVLVGTERLRQLERSRVSAGGRDGALEVNDPGSAVHLGLGGAERGVDPAIDEGELGEELPRLRERGSVERGEALGVGERSALGLHTRHAVRLDDQ